MATCRWVLFPQIAQSAGQQEFHLRMHVFHIRIDGETALGRLAVNLPQFRQQHRKLVRSQQAHLFQHGDVRHCSQHVEGCQIQIHLPIVSDREFFDFRIDGKSFVPEFICHNNRSVLQDPAGRTEGVCRRHCRNAVHGSQEPFPAVCRQSSGSPRGS